jgi:hypothetical protein
MEAEDEDLANKLFSNIFRTVSRYIHGGFYETFFTTVQKNDVFT